MSIFKLKAVAATTAPDFRKCPLSDIARLISDEAALELRILGSLGIENVAYFYPQRFNSVWLANEMNTRIETAVMHDGVLGVAARKKDLQARSAAACFLR